MANAHDAVIAQDLINAYERGGAPGLRVLLFDLLPMLQDDACYWQLLGTMWIAAGSHADAERWLALFRANRARPWKVMKPADRRVWRALPARVVAYRAGVPGERYAFSWSLDPAVPRRLWPELPVRGMTFARERIRAYFDRRGEREVLVLPP